MVTKADAFTDRIVNMYKVLNERKEFIISKQALRSGTSIGASITEGFSAQSNADFVSKLSIALKESDETLYWLRKLRAGSFISEKEYNSMEADNKEISKLLTSIIKTKKRNMEK